MGHYYDDYDKGKTLDYKDHSDLRLSKAKAYLKNAPFAGAGSNGSLHTLKVISHLIELGLTEKETVAVLAPWNVQYDPPWSESDLEQTVRNAFGVFPGLINDANPITANSDRIREIQKKITGEVRPPSEKKPTNPKDAVGIRKPRFFSGMSGHVRRLIGIGMLEGAMKYGRHNYRPAAVRASVYYDATNEHLDSFWEGEDVDPDSGLPHVIKAICSLMVLADAIVTGNLVDDRPPRTVAVSEMKKRYQKLVDDLFKRYPNPEEAFTHLNSVVETLPIDKNPFLNEGPVKTAEEK